MADDWRIRIDVAEEQDSLLERLGLDLSSEARELAKELEGRRLVVSRDDETIFVYAGTQQEAERARGVIEAELRETGAEATVGPAERWLPEEDRRSSKRRKPCSSTATPRGRCGSTQAPTKRPTASPRGSSAKDGASCAGTNTCSSARTRRKRRKRSPSSCTAKPRRAARSSTRRCRRIRSSFSAVSAGAGRLCKTERRGWDLNPRATFRPPPVFKTGPFDRSGTPPGLKGSRVLCEN